MPRKAAKNHWRLRIRRGVFIPAVKFYSLFHNEHMKYAQLAVPDS
jgi:hypothetical protein